MPPMIFDTLPPALSALCQTLFPDSFPAVALLPLQEYWDEQSPFPLSSWLHQRELKRLAGYSHPKRKREWLAGRLCAKQALRVFLRHCHPVPLLPEHQHCLVLSEESGRPYFDHLAGLSFPPPNLSISHSHSTAVALVCSGPGGIDLQHPAETLVKVKKHFCRAGEEERIGAALPGLSPLLRLALLWSGKEAIKKMLSPTGIPGFHEILLDQATATGKTDAILSFVRTSEPTVRYPVAAGVLASGYTLALCCLPPGQIES